MWQIITKAGAANIPPWYDAGKVWLQEHPAFPFGAPKPSTLNVCGVIVLSGAHHMRRTKQFNSRRPQSGCRWCQSIHSSAITPRLFAPVLPA